MIFIYNTTDAKVGINADVSEGATSADINIVVNNGEGQIKKRVLSTSDKDVAETVSKWGTDYEELRVTPYRRVLEVPNKQRVVYTDKDEIKVFSLSDEGDENKQYPRVILFVISDKDAEIFTDERNVYKPIETVDIGDYKLSKILIKWGRWSSLKIRTFITFVCGDVKKKIQLVGIQSTISNDNGERQYTINNLNVSDMTDEEYEVIKSGKAPEFGTPSLLIGKNNRNGSKKTNVEDEERKPYRKNKKSYGHSNDNKRDKEYPNKKRSNHGRGNSSNGKFENHRNTNGHGGSNKDFRANKNNNNRQSRNNRSYSR